MSAAHERADVEPGPSGTGTGGEATAAFQVDLRGVVDLLARHLYSSPRVYLRELLQNGVDAITARVAVEGSEAPSRILLRPLPDGGLEVHDSGVGLTRDEAQELLATIGRSSKRDVELGSGREEFLGQFGIGLLSAFMVADEIELVSRSARRAPSGAPAAPVRWRGRADGRYELVELGADDPAAPAEPGSVVRLRPRRDTEHWLAPETVVALAQDFGSLLPVELLVETRLDDAAATATDVVRRRLSGDELPWHVAHPTTAARDAALTGYAERTLGFAPLARIDLDLPLAGLSGVAYVLPAAVAPTTTARHRVYLKRMLLGSAVDDLLPPWAFFVRCVLDASVLRPTASREGLYEDEVLLATRGALGAQVRRWLLETLAADTVLARRFLETHHLAVRALALTDDEMLDVAARVLPFETTAGAGTLADLAEAHPEGRLLYTSSVEEFRRIAPVAAAQGLAVVNGGYVYDADLLERVAARFPQWRLSPVSATDVAHVLAEVEPLRELEVADALASVDAALADQDCDVVLRRYEPDALPAMLLHDRDGDHAREAARVAGTDDLWGEILAGISGPARPRRLVLNDANDTVRDLLASPDAEVRAAGARSLYVTAVLASGKALQPVEAALMNDSLSLLLARALAARPGRGAHPHPEQNADEENR
ncbi:HSP90 family protein [Cellulosimicrobium protaetiae]|uniref:HSP90 family protein n=1 Tax=Cellulosimicrobium protaetiae TaxID=2587808 RepID=A0A6M5UHM1_9MICO|nr:HSP90 family protein [Cellulosimicrobium protaetiae]QJW37052.1 HSP90 family protein [Cellulosimicrobium protaetiae]